MNDDFTSQLFQALLESERRCKELQADNHQLKEELLKLYETIAEKHDGE